MKLGLRILSCFLSFAIAVTMMCGLVTVQAGALTNADITSRLDALRDQWNGKRFQGYNDSSYGGKQCYSFARYIAEQLFGSYPGNLSVDDGYVDGNGWKAIKNSSNVVFEPGDLLGRYKSGSQHWAIVWKVEGDVVYFAQSINKDTDGDGYKDSVIGRWDKWQEWDTNIDYYSCPNSTISELLGGHFVGIWKHPGASNSTVSQPVDIGNNFCARIVNTAANKPIVAESDNNVDLKTDSDKLNQKWYFNKQGDGSYIIYNCDHNVLDFSGQGDNVYVWEDNGSDSQNWFIYGEPGSYILKNKTSDKVLDISNASVDDGANAQVWENNGTTAQKFSICYISSPDIGYMTGTYPRPGRNLYYTSPVMSGDDVRWVQSCMNILGISCDIDGSYGPSTADCIKTFQSWYGLDVDGKCGPATQDAIYNAVKPTGYTIAADNTNIEPATSTNVTVTPNDNRTIRNYVFYVVLPSGYTDTYYRHGDNVFKFYPKQGEGTYKIYCYIQNECDDYSDENNCVTITVGFPFADIAQAEISPIDQQIYTGSEIMPGFTVTYCDAELVPDIDYTVEYSNNIEVGTATITITGAGNNYIGTKTATFKIVKPAPTKPEVTTTAGDEQVTLTWNDMGATKYAAYLVNADGTLKALSTKLTGTAYTAKKLTSGTEYTFLVRAYVNGKWTKYDATDYVKATPFSTVVKPTVEIIPADKQVTLTWDAIDGATKYAVYRLQDDGTLKALATKLTDTEYTVKKLVNHTEYQFLVRAYVNGKWTKYDANDYVSATPAALKPLVRVSEYDGMVTLRWGAVDDATKYAAYIVNDDDSLTCVSSKITNIKYTVKKLTNGTAYRFVVRAYVNGKWTKYTERDIVTATPHA